MLESIKKDIYSIKSIIFVIQTIRMSLSTTEITSGEIASDNPIHQRLLFAYAEAGKMISGNVLDIGCGEGRGLEYLLKNVSHYTAIDKIQLVLDALKAKYPQHNFIQGNIPPFPIQADGQFDFVVSFQVIEHIEDHEGYIREIVRMLKPGGKAIISTPNIDMSLTRNPWHVREYKVEEMRNLFKKYFSKVELKGVYGAKNVNDYFEQNKKSVEKITRWDIFNLQYNLPRTWLQIPYDILNRMNRNKLSTTNDELVKSITINDFRLENADEKCYDLFLIAEK